MFVQVYPSIINWLYARQVTRNVNFPVLSDLKNTVLIMNGNDVWLPVAAQYQFKNKNNIDSTTSRSVCYTTYLYV